MVNAIEWEDAYLSMPWGVHHYRFSSLDADNFPHLVEVEDEGIWESCPNINVALRIQRMIF